MSRPPTPTRFSSHPESTTRSKAINVGKPLGIYDTNSVRDRVWQWQAQGGGVIETEGMGIADIRGDEVRSTSRNLEKRHSFRTPSSRHAGNGSDISTQTRTVDDVSRIDESKTREQRPRSAPTKRVVSDSHWRKEKSPHKRSPSARNTGSEVPSRIPSDDGIRVKPLTEPKPERGGRRASKRKTPQRQNFGDDAGIRVRVTPPGSRRYSERQDKLQSVPAGNLPEVASNNEDTSLGSSHNPDHNGKGSFVAKEDRRQQRQSSTRQEETDGSPQLVRNVHQKGSTRSQRGNILSQVFGDSRKLFAKQPLEPITTPRLPSIEAWLDNTPDPFIDEPEPAIEEIAPLKPSLRKDRTIEQDSTAVDPSRIWESLDTKEGTRRAMSGNTKKRRVPSSAIYAENPFPSDFDSGFVLSDSGPNVKAASKLVDLTQDTTDGSPSTLKRRAARKNVSSPLRESRKSQTPVESPVESPKEGDAASAQPSRSTASSVKRPVPQTQLKPSRLNVTRPFPSTGQHRLSTIASVETLNCPANIAIPPSISEVSGQTFHAGSVQKKPCLEEAKDKFNPDSLKRATSRLTKHADLISILSLPRAGSQSIRSARSIRTSRSRLGTATLEDLMHELALDESKYMRELRTLVDGVIPVLLTCVLSKSDSAVAAGLFRPSSSAREEPNFARPIVDMGIALERLKTLHKRIPLKDPSALLVWAHGAQRVYVEYMKAWRMGFQDVVVNLAPALESAQLSTIGPSLEEGLPRDKNGDIINGDGEKVDVAFLLKRPLVRLKYLAKTLKGINFVRPTPEAENLTAKYQMLVENARLRVNQERARLEDEAAANIDPTRARDPRTLAPLSGVTLDKTHRVRARDHFNLALQHSSGQCVDCRVELLLRDEATKIGNGGDLLICEVDGSGRWLLFPSIKTSLVSARNGDKEGEIIVMVRGFNRDGSEWHETFSLRTDDEQAGFEWVQMLGLEPVPSSLGRSNSFLDREQKRRSVMGDCVHDHLIPDTATSANKSRTPSPRQVDVPIGEQANGTSKQWAGPPSPRQACSPTTTLAARKPDDILLCPSSNFTTDYTDQINDRRRPPSQTRAKDIRPIEPVSRPRSFQEALGLSGTSAMSGLRRTKAKRLSKNLDSSPSNLRSRTSCHDGGDHAPSMSSSEVEVKMSGALINTDNLLSSSPPANIPHDPRSSTHGANREPKEPHPANHRQSSVPSMELPCIPRARKSSPPVTPIIEPVEEPVWSTPPESRDADTPTKLRKRRSTPGEANIQSGKSPPAVPVHISPSLDQLDSPHTPALEQRGPKVRRSSSPLKHEYEPSTATESSSDSDASTVEHYEVESMTDSSDDEELEAGDVPTPLMPIDALKRFPKPSSKPASLAMPDGTLKPSDSASQAPYKTVPAQPKKAAKTIASIFVWSETGSWESLHPDECSIVITPGLIEAFEMSATHSISKPPSALGPTVDGEKFAQAASNVTSQNDNVQNERPLVALELTPLVPLRRGTAIDISIRSPPTPNSRITSGNNIMFRSRNPEECEALYALINHSRIHNPTYVALQNARGPFVGSSFPGGVGRRPSSRAANSRSSWFGSFGRSSSYRASGARPPSIAPSDSSVGSMSSAFSALKRFGKGSGGGIFNIALSTITSRNGTGSGANSVYTSSDNSTGSGTSSPMPPGMVANKDGSLGLKDAKIRLYIRETASRWRDMGSARLTIIRAEGHVIVPDGRPMSSGGHNQATHEKRIVVNGKTKGEILLDAQLGESCFERVARTGIAVSVWEDVVGPNGEVGVVGAVGGVAGGRTKVYMIQVCGKLETLG
ncbi:MAG: hypothetical protein Q9217_002075 [Psora testacea]